MKPLILYVIRTSSCTIKAITFNVALLLSLGSIAQSNEGTYYHSTYSAKEYSSTDFGSSPQNWGVAQDHRGVMYFCNSSGILEFDGNTWRMVSGTENLDMFKATCGADGIIYTGGIEEFGYLGKSSKGGIIYHSLKPLLPDSLLEFGKIRMVKTIGDSIAFMCQHNLFIYHDNKVVVHSSEDRYRRLFNFHGGIVVQLYEAGLCELKGDEFIPMHENSMPEGRIIRHIFGPQSKPLMTCNKKGVLQIWDNELQYQPTELDTLTLWNGYESNSNFQAIGSNELGALIIDDHCQIKDVFHEDYDLTGHSVITPFFDINNQLWLASSNGIQHIEYPSQLSYLNERDGVTGIPLCIDDSDQDLLIGTTEGLFIQSKTQGRFKLESLESQKHEDEFVTDIINLNNDKLILTSYGLFRKEEEGYSRITEIGGFNSAVIDSSGNKIIYGGVNGIIHVSKINGKWQADRTIDKIDHSIMSVSSQNKDRSWASMFSISKIDLTETGANVTLLDSTHGFVSEMGPTWTFIHRDEAYFCTPLGLYKWNENIQKLEPDDLFGEELSRGMMSNPVVIDDNTIWISHEKGIGAVDLATKEFKDRDLRRMDYSDVWRIHPTEKGHFWILTTEAIVRYDPSIDNSYQNGFNAIIRGVTTKEDSLLFDGYFSSASGAPLLIQPNTMIPTLDYRSNQVSIKYAATYYNAADKITFSTYLEGQDEKWSAWSDRPFKDFMNLREGEYTFKVKARNVYGVEGEIASYAFTILPPWYRTSWAYLVYLVLIALGIWGVAVLYSLRLRKQKKELEGIVKDRTKEIALEKEKSDNLLLNILPEETANELKNQGFATTRSYEKVSVLFTDFVSFSSISETMTPEDLVAEIDHCFSAFDEIVDKEGVEKIKTIGDAYMCASGLNHDGANPEIRLVNVGIAIRDFMKAHNKIRTEQGLPSFEIRIGIHTGPVVAGVVGKKKFAYDIWGDTVNTAARMESNSHPGELNVSASTYAVIKEDFICEYRGKIEAKNKGKLDMYFVRGVAED